MPHRIRWQGDRCEPDAIVRLPDDAYRLAAAYEAHRVAGLLARAELHLDHLAAARHAAELRALVEVLSRPGMPERRLAPGEALARPVFPPRDGARLFTGDAPSLWEGLRPLIAEAAQLDVVVAYVTRGGVGLVRSALQSALAGGCTLRLLAGCYLGGTLPEALRDLHALTAPFSNARVRFVEDPDRHFHPKVYRIVGRDGSVSLFVGSSNLSRDALTGARDALEWNLALDDATAAALLDDARLRIDALFAREGVPLDEAAIARWEMRSRSFLPPAALLDAEAPPTPVTPNAAQREALQALAQVRREGYSRALVVAATGVGKTILAALDSCAVVPPGRGRVLFVAHRQELLLQARSAFERVRGDEGTHGFVHQEEKSVHADHVYASVWSLDALSDDALRRFDYVVVDEAHHGAAKSYRRLLDTVRPRFVLGLTATPERLDGANIYALFDGVVAWERSLLEAIGHGWLVPFRYFGVPDPVDYRSLEWTGGALGYRAADLEAAMLDDARTARVLDALADPRHAGTRTLVFCVSIAHAERTAAALEVSGWRVACVHSGPGAAQRDRALDELRAGRLDAIVAVDVFNEGVDVPELDRVVLLRPTDSPSVFLQQLGRGLRPYPGKAALTVLDLVGNHRRARARLALLGVRGDDLAGAAVGSAYARRWDDGREVHLTPEALDAVRAVERAAQGPRARLVAAVAEQYADGGRPSLTAVLSRTGLSVTTIVNLFGSWLDLLEAAGARDGDDARLAASPAARELLVTLERTAMSGPHKMVLLGAMAERRVEQVTVREGGELFRAHLETRHAAVRTAFVDAATGRDRLDDKLRGDIPRRYPMAVLAETHPRCFSLRGDAFRINLPDDVPAALVFEALIERADARLYEFARRRPGAGEVAGKVLGLGNDRLCLMLAKEARKVAPIGEWITLVSGERRFRACVMMVAINVIHEESGESNVATALLLRATDSDRVEDAKGRTVRLRRREDAAWELELT